MTQKADVLQGTMDLLILHTLQLEPMHGYGIAQRLDQVTHGVFHVNPGTLFPALYRMEEEGLLTCEWRPSENNRRAKYYTLSKAGRRQLAVKKRYWDQISVAIQQVLDT